MCVSLMCVYIDSGWWDQIFLSICAIFSSFPEKQPHKRQIIILTLLEPQQWEFSTPTSHVQYSLSRNVTPLQLWSWGNDAKVMQAWSQLRYNVAIWERSANPAANVRSSGQLNENPASCRSGREGLAVPAGWCQRRGNQAGCLAAWLLGWVAGRVAWFGDHVALLCKF